MSSQDGKSSIAVSPDILEVIRGQGPEFLIGMDIPRIWTTGAQVFVSPDMSTLVFREQAALQGEDGTVQTLARNVASLIIPTEVLRQFSEILAQELGKLDAPEAE